MIMNKKQTTYFFLKGYKLANNRINVMNKTTKKLYLNIELSSTLNLWMHFNTKYS